MLALMTEVQERLQARRLCQCTLAAVRWVVLLVLLHGPAREALAGTLYANDLSDGSPTPASCASSSNTSCSLRAAIMQANSLGGSHTIVLQTGQTYTLSLDSTAGEEDTGAEDDLDVTADIVIQGNGAIIERSGTCNLDGNADTGEFRIFEVRSGATLTLQNVTVQNGCADGPTTRAHDRLGGGILNLGTLTLTNCTISANSANQAGGGILNATIATATLTNSTISGNSTTVGGGIFNGGTLTLTNSTISGNAASNGSAILNQFGATLNATFVTVANNTEGLGIRNEVEANSAAGTINIKNSIVADNPEGNCANNFGATFNSQGGNFASDDSCPGFTQSPSLNLGPLANNGGATQTHALGAGSSAIDAVSDCTDLSGSPVSTDQRGVTRPQGSQCDAGAFEAGADMEANAPSVPPSLGPGGSYTLTFSCTNNGSGAATNATCAVSVSAGAISGFSCSPPLPVASLANGSTISCTYTFTAPGTPGGGDTLETGVTFTVTASSETFDPDMTNNTATSGATPVPIVDAVDDAASFPGGSSQSFNLAGNDGAPPGASYTLVSSTCDAAAVTAGGIVTFTVPAAGACTVQYRLCHDDRCDTASLNVRATLPAPIPAVREWGVMLLMVVLLSMGVACLRRAMQ